MPKFTKTLEVDIDLNLDDIVIMMMVTGKATPVELRELGVSDDLIHSFNIKWSKIDDQLKNLDVYPEAYINTRHYD